MFKILKEGIQAHPKTAAAGLSLVFTLVVFYWLLCNFLIVD